MPLSVTHLCKLREDYKARRFKTALYAPLEEWNACLEWRRAWVAAIENEIAGAINVKRAARRAVAGNNHIYSNERG